MTGMKWLPFELGMFLAGAIWLMVINPDVGPPVVLMVTGAFCAALSLVRMTR